MASFLACISSSFLNSLFIFFCSRQSLEKVAMEMEGPSRLPREERSWSGGFGLWVFGLWVVCVEGFWLEFDSRKGIGFLFEIL